jgi:hypothetical protein
MLAINTNQSINQEDFNFGGQLATNSKNLVAKLKF